MVEDRLGRFVVGWDGLGELRGKVYGWLGWFRVVEGRLGRFVVGWDNLGGLRVGREGLWLVGMV